MELLVLKYNFIFYPWRNVNDFLTGAYKDNLFFILGTIYTQIIQGIQY